MTPSRQPLPRLLFAGLLLVASSCGDDDTQVDLGPPAPDLVLPDLTGLDMAESLKEGIDLVLAADLRQPWAGFDQTLELGIDGCPDLYAGSYENADDTEGMSWSDSCLTSGGTEFNGDLHWDAYAAAQSGDDGSSVQYGDRSLEGGAAVEADDTRLFGFQGEGADSVYTSTGEDYVHWTYSATVQATVTGTLAFPPSSTWPGGWREDMYLYYAGGDQNLLELRGDLYLLQDTFGRFDSVSLDMTLQGPLGASPDGCTLEPSGYIGLRDTSAYWYEVVFLPADADTTDPPEGACDGCGTLFVRGVEQEGLVCMSFDWLWDSLSAPPLADFIMSDRY